MLETHVGFTPACITITHVKPRVKQVLAKTAYLFIVPAIALFYKHGPNANGTTVALSLLLAVLIASAIWGFWYAALLAVLSTLAFNFFFLPPLGTLTIAESQNWIALFAFLATAVIAGQLSERARREALRATQRRREIEYLYAFTQRLLTLKNVPELLNIAPRHIVETFGCKEAAIYVLQKTDIYRSGKDTAAIEAARLQSVAARGEPIFDSDAGLAFIPLRLGIRSIGAIGISKTILSHESLDALSTLVAITLERTEAIESVGKAEAARENDKLRSAILDSIAHEFRTPLTSIKASATALLGDGLNSTQQLELLTVIDEEADRMNHLVEEATQVAQLESKQVELELQPQEIGKVIDRAIKSARKALSKHTVELRIEEDLPPVQLDAELIVNVIYQLLENAAKYSPVDSAIRVSAENTGKEIIVSVADRGQGIDHLEQSLIFDKFYRGKSNRYSVRGTGMGLAIAKAVVEAHDGTLRVTSQVGHGSVFSFTLPLDSIPGNNRADQQRAE